METERLKGLCERWSVEWRERGSVNRPMILDLNKTPDAHVKLRSEWNGMIPKDYPKE
jgi:hypothetical protein